jgi:uncharacterized protein (TIGR02001 family)
MKKLIHALVLSGLVGVPAYAVAAEEESPHSLSANVTLTSNYIFRGISQTGGDPAIQGGLDYSHASGFYLGTWASNVGWLEDFQAYDRGSMEIDFYGGFRGPIGASDFTFDVGGIYYMYPGKNDTGGLPDADTGEIYAALGWKWFTAKYSYYLTDDVFGITANGGSYLGLSASLPVADTGLTLGASWGTFDFGDTSAADYDDWSISAAYDMGKLGALGDGVTVGVKYTDTNAEEGFWTQVYNDGDTEFIGDSAFTVWVTKAF